MPAATTVSASELLGLRHPFEMKRLRARLFPRYQGQDASGISGNDKQSKSQASHPDDDLEGRDQLIYLVEPWRAPARAEMFRHYRDRTDFDSSDDESDSATAIDNDSDDEICPSKSKEATIVINKSEDPDIRLASVQPAVMRIPDTVLIQIFVCHSASLPRLVTISSVCRSWRFAILNEPKIWTTLRFKLSFQYADTSSLQSLIPFFKRSGEEPLEVAIEYDTPAALDQVSFYTSMLPDKRRWQTLHTGPLCIRTIFSTDSIFQTLDNLEELFIYQQIQTDPVLQNISLNCPLLRHLSVSISGRFSRELVPAPWSQLLTLSLDTRGSSILDFLDVLRQCINLEKCTLGFRGAFDPPKAIPKIRILLVKLTSLTLFGYCDVTPLLSFLMFPALNSLHIQSKSSPSVLRKAGEVIKSFIVASGCDLKILEIEAQELFFSEIAMCLVEMPLLTHLKLSIFNQPTPSLPFVLADGLYGDGGIVRLPNLRSFVMSGLYLSLPLSWFLNILKPQALEILEPRYDPLQGGIISFCYRDGSLHISTGVRGVKPENILFTVRRLRRSIKMILPADNFLPSSPNSL